MVPEAKLEPGPDIGPEVLELKPQPQPEPTEGKEESVVGATGTMGSAPSIAGGSKPAFSFGGSVGSAPLFTEASGSKPQPQPQPELEAQPEWGPGPGLEPEPHALQQPRPELEPVLDPVPWLEFEPVDKPPTAPSIIVGDTGEAHFAKKTDSSMVRQPFEKMLTDTLSPSPTTITVMTVQETAGGSAAHEAGRLGLAQEASTTSYEGHVCVICLEGGEPGSLVRGCACRGSAGFAHQSCLVTAAQANKNSWDTCPTCKQTWTGQVQLGLGWAHVELTASLPEDNYERLRAAMQLMVALRSSGELAEALQLGLATLETMRRVTPGDESGPLPALMLQVMGMLATVFNMMGEHTAALPLQMERLATSRRLLGDDYEGTLVAISELGGTHLSMGDCTAALPLLEEALERGRRTHGNDRAETMGFMNNLATAYARMTMIDRAYAERALRLFTEAFEAKRRVLGSRNPDTLTSMGNLGNHHHNIGNFPAALPLLEEAVVGLTAECGEDHQETRHFKAKLDDLRKDMSDPQVVAQVEAYLHQQRLQAEQRQGEGREQNFYQSRPQARIVGIQSRPELNGQVVHVGELIEATGRFRVLVPASEVRVAMPGGGVTSMRSMHIHIHIHIPLY
jgi:hypothetical protein